MTTSDSGSDGLSFAPIAPLVRAETLSQRTANLIRSAIVEGRLPAGSQMTVAAVAKICGVSATPAREALIRLSEIGLLSFGPHGVTIVPTTKEALQGAFECREPLEGMAARLAARRASPAQQAAISELAEASMTAAGDGLAGDFRTLDIKFHLEIAVAARSPQLQRNLHSALDLVHTLRGLTRVTTKAGLAYMHRDIAAAISDRDEDGAERHMRYHISAALDQFLANNPLDS